MYKKKNPWKNIRQSPDDGGWRFFAKNPRKLMIFNLLMDFNLNFAVKPRHCHLTMIKCAWSHNRNVMVVGEMRNSYLVAVCL